LPAVNFAVDVVEAAPRDRAALVALARDGTRSELSFGEVADRSAGWPGRWPHAESGRATW
jgi:hypothetical protein